MHLACLIRCEFAQSDKAVLLDKLRRASSGLPTYQAKPRHSRLSCQGLSRERRTVNVSSIFQNFSNFHFFSYQNDFRLLRFVRAQAIADTGSIDMSFEPSGPGGVPSEGGENSYLPSFTI